MTDTYLVTGGAGFIGSNLVDELLRRGHTVRVIDNFSTGLRDNLTHIQADIDLIEGDIQSYERVHHAMKGVDYVIHLAALPFLSFGFLAANAYMIGWAVHAGMSWWAFAALIGVFYAVLVGAGLAGLTAAYLLARPGCALLFINGPAEISLSKLRQSAWGGFATVP